MPGSVSTRPLVDKLDVRPGARLALVGLADPAFRELLRGRTTDVTDGEARHDTDVAFLAADSVGELAPLAALRDRLRPNGAIWVVSRKGRSATLRDVDVIAIAKATGLVDNKVVSFSATHTARRLVIPVALRGPDRAARE